MAKVTWAGQSCFQIVSTNGKDNSTTVVIDPFEEDIGLKMPRFEADIILVTHQHKDHNNIKAIKGEPFLVETPGEYEIKGVFIRGISSFHDDTKGKERGPNTIYTIETEDMKFCHMGDFGQKELTDEQLEAIGSIDILMIPVGGTYTIDASQASRIIGQIEPKLIVPMHYALPKLTVELDAIDAFLKAMGKNSAEKQEKLIVKASSLPKEQSMEIVLLSHST
jgi:L-ascorbate metabolism protein UlaG (beta-lactamase superfamily)